MKNTVSLNKNIMFRKVYSKGINYANKYLVVYYLPNRTSTNRLGITVSKKLGGAVVRNRVKRLIRESYRLNEDRVAKGYDIVIVARKQIVETDFKGVYSALIHLFKKISLLVNK